MRSARECLVQESIYRRRLDRRRRGWSREHDRPGHDTGGYGVLLIDETVIQEAGERLHAAAPSARVILFGSHARGEGGPHRDLDFLVIEPEVENPAGESVRLLRALRELLVPVDIIVVSERHVEEWREVRDSLVHAALADGRVLAA